MVLICIFLMTNDVKHLSRCLLVICISLLVKCLSFKSLPIFIGFLIKLYKFFTLDTSSLDVFLQIFSPCLCLISSFY